MICCNITGEVYYGATKVCWKSRLSAHKNEKNLCRSRYIINRGDYEFIVLEEVDDDQLLVRENYYITTFPCINHKKLNAIFECECGSKIRRSNKSYHFKMKKHLDFINSI
jgi:hypothetical protein